jgi:hypothetical protein
LFSGCPGGPRFPERELILIHIKKKKFLKMAYIGNRA